MIPRCVDFALSIVMPARVVARKVARIAVHTVGRIVTRVIVSGLCSGSGNGIARRRIVATASCVFLTLLVTQPVAATDKVVFSVEEQARIRLHGPWPVPVPPDPGNEYSGLAWAEEAGRLLFSDSGLSGNNAISCASCHQVKSGFSDRRAVAIGSKVHFRNTQTLLNAGLQKWFGWDGGTDSLWAATLRPLLSNIEMDNSVQGIATYLRQAPQYKTYLQRRVNDERVALSALSDAEVAVKAAKFVAAYVRTIASGVTPFDKFRDALAQGNSIDERDFSLSARRGLKLFTGSANCHVCHYGANFSNGEFHDIGRPFFIGRGQIDTGRYSGIQRLRSDPYRLSGIFNGTDNRREIRKTQSVKLSRADWGRWRTPTLRNLVDTSPYMHDGSIATLRGVIDAYADIDTDRLHSEGESILKPLDLSERQRDDLVAFLRALSQGDQQ